MMKKVAVIAVMGALLAGCQTTNPYTEEAQTNKTSVGAATGAIVGGIVGALANGKNGAAAGAALGAAAGGGWGYYMDSQEDKLRAELRGTGVSVKRNGDQLVLVMPSDITFGFDKSDINPDFNSVLTSVSKVLVEYDKTDVLVKGYTDSFGRASYNKTLSQKRAASVTRYLEAHGVAQQRMTTLGYGEADLIVKQGTKEQQAPNRRVEVELVQRVNQ